MEFKDLVGLSDDYFDTSAFFYLCVLAKSLGFERAVESLKMVWERTVLRVRRLHPGWDMGWSFQSFVSSDLHDFDFQPMDAFPGDMFDPGPSFWTAVHASFLTAAGDNQRIDDDDFVFIVELVQSAFYLLGPELLSTMHFIFFLRLLHYPNSNYNAQFSARQFGQVWDLGLLLQ